MSRSTAKGRVGARMEWGQFIFAGPGVSVTRLKVAECSLANRNPLVCFKVPFPPVFSLRSLSSLRLKHSAPSLVGYRPKCNRNRT